jgi:hypothetical protein
MKVEACEFKRGVDICVHKFNSFDVEYVKGLLGSGETCPEVTALAIAS